MELKTGIRSLYDEFFRGCRAELGLFCAEFPLNWRYKRAHPLSRNRYAYYLLIAFDLLPRLREHPRPLSDSVRPGHACGWSQEFQPQKEECFRCGHICRSLCQGCCSFFLGLAVVCHISSPAIRGQRSDPEDLPVTEVNRRHREGGARRERRRRLGGSPYGSDAPRSHRRGPAVPHHGGTGVRGARDPCAVRRRSSEAGARGP